MSERAIKVETLADLSFEDRQSLVGFFELLLQIDRRVNPNLYENNRDPDNTN
jgi:hypothetical protein